MNFRLWFTLLTWCFLLGVLFDLPWLIIFSAAIGSVIGLAEYWRRHALDNLVYRRHWKYRRGFPGEKTPFSIEVVNEKWLPVSWMQITDPWPDGVEPEEQEYMAPSHNPDEKMLTNVYSLRWFERVVRQYNLVFRQRGLYSIGPVSLRSGDLFGFYETSQQQTANEYLTVFPEILSLAQLNLPTEDPFGYQQTIKRLFEDPNHPIGVRPYHPEDEIRRIHWNATARTGSLQVKVYQPVSSHVFTVCLDVTTSIRPWLGTAPALLEQLVKVCATLVYHGIEQNFAVGLISNGYLAHSDHPFNVAPGRSTEHLARLLQTLAAVTPLTSSNFETFLTRSMGKIPYGASLVVVTGVMTDLLKETLVRLRRYRPHITLISLDNSDLSDIPGIQTIHITFQG
jgi:uncharacterized protein (DUF58 family)